MAGAIALAIVSCQQPQRPAGSGLGLIEPDYSRSMEAVYAAKPVLAALTLEKELDLRFPNLTGKRAQGPADDPDYATYGSASVRYDLKGLDASAYNRLFFRVKPDCDGQNVTTINMSLDGQFSHQINLRNHEWNDCWLELGENDLSSLRQLVFTASIKGKDNAAAGDSSFYKIKDIAFQKVDQIESITGWEPLDGRIIYSTSGYLPSSTKTAIVSAATASLSESFYIMKDGRSVFSGKVQSCSTSIGDYGVLDFSAFTTPGRYTIRLGNVESADFAISDELWNSAETLLLNYIFGQRCGSEVPGIHGECHTDLFADHAGTSISYGGGWHDAGDLSQQTLQTGDVAFALMEAAMSQKYDQGLALAMMKEARWGLEFLLNCRFGDGWRASSMGLKHWTDNTVGTYDDIHTVRTQNNSFDNFLCAAYEAFGAMNLNADKAFKDALRKAAIEDFDFALAKYNADGFDRFPHIMEHSYNTSESQFMATASWAASMMYQLTSDAKYAQLASEYISYVTASQHTEPLADGSCGFFYRNTDKIAPVHFIHQSRDQIYAQALALICKTQKDNAQRPVWEASLKMYAEYLKSLMKYTAPYGMVPSGIYREHEYQEAEAFGRLHIFSPADAYERFDTQLHKGVQIDSEYFVKRFPIWFNIYNGNNAIMLSTGKAAAICGNYFDDAELREIGLEQLYWVVGKNPFGQSMIFGEGHNYPQMNSFSSGEISGEIPVGIRSIDDEDVPYWPAVTNACYKEVWVTSAGKALSLIAEY